MARNKKKHTHKREIHTQDRQLFMDLLQVSMIKKIQIRKKNTRINGLRKMSQIYRRIIWKQNKIEIYSEICAGAGKKKILSKRNIC